MPLEGRNLYHGRYDAGACSYGGFAPPTAVLNPENSIDVFSLAWTFLLHPGATQSSGLTRMYADVCNELDISLNRDIMARYQEAVERASHSSTLSSGSVEGVGLQASEPQNMGVACGFLAEGSKFLEWLKHESGVNKSICTELMSVSSGNGRRSILRGPSRCIIHTMALWQRACGGHC